MSKLGTGCVCSLILERICSRRAFLVLDKVVGGFGNHLNHFQFFQSAASAEVALFNSGGLISHRTVWIQLQCPQSYSTVIGNGFRCLMTFPLLL